MSVVGRLVDANASRAREGLRVVEDVARFVLCDGALAGELKGLRHGLQEAVGGLPIDRGVLLAWRDAGGDVGAESSTVGERSRGGLSAVVAAAGGRVAEGLRAIEEAAKVLGGDAVGFERLRYRAYDLCGAVERGLGTGRGEQWRVCVLLTESLCEHHSWLRVAELAMDGGADCLQLREKGIGTRELVGRARELVAVARPRGVRVVVNDRADVAVAAGADGVHVGQGDMDLQDVRRLAGHSLLVGVSTGSVAQARLAAAGGADYCGVGPMFASTTKRKPAVAGVEYLRGYVGDGACARVPHLAIGGITPRNVGGLVEAGCRGVAVSSVVCGAEEPGEVCRELVAGLGG